MGRTAGAPNKVTLNLMEEDMLIIRSITFFETSF